MNESPALLIPATCPEDIKLILNKYFLECSDNLKDVIRRLITEPKTLQLWKELDKKDPMEKEVITLNLLQNLGLHYQESLEVEKFSKDKKRIDLIKKKQTKLKKNFNDLAEEINKLEIISKEEKNLIQDDINNLFFGIECLLDPTDIYGLIHGDEFNNSKTFRNKGQKNAHQIFLAKVIAKEFKILFNQSLYKLAFLISHVLLDIKISDHITDVHMRDSARRYRQS